MWTTIIGIFAQPLINLLEKLLVAIGGFLVEKFKEWNTERFRKNQKEIIEESKKKLESEDEKTKLEGNKQSEDFWDKLT